MWYFYCVVINLRLDSSLLFLWLFRLFVLLLLVLIFLSLCFFVRFFFCLLLCLFLDFYLDVRLASLTSVVALFIIPVSFFRTLSEYDCDNDQKYYGYNDPNVDRDWSFLFGGRWGRLVPVKDLTLPVVPADLSIGVNLSVCSVNFSITRVTVYWTKVLEPVSVKFAL